MFSKWNLHALCHGTFSDQSYGCVNRLFPLFCFYLEEQWMMGARKSIGRTLKKLWRFRRFRIRSQVNIDWCSCRYCPVHAVGTGVKLHCSIIEVVSTLWWESRRSSAGMTLEFTQGCNLLWAFLFVLTLGYILLSLVTSLFVLRYYFLWMIMSSNGINFQAN